MKWRTILILAALAAIIFVVALVLFTGTKPQLSISRIDIHTGALVTELNRSNLPDTNITVAVWIRLNGEAATRFNKLLQDRPNQEIHIMDGTDVVAAVAMYQVSSKSDLNLFFTNANEAGVVCNALFKR